MSQVTFRASRLKRKRLYTLPKNSLSNKSTLKKVKKKLLDDSINASSSSKNINIKKNKSKPENNCLENSSTTGNFTYKYLLENINNISKPDEWYFVRYNTYILFCQIDLKAMVSRKKIAINKSLEVEFILDGEVLPWLTCKNIESLEQVEYIMKFFSNLII